MKMALSSVLMVGSALLASASISNISSFSVDLSDIHSVITGMEAIENMQATFLRSDEEHTKSMDALMKNMTGAQALEILKNTSKNNALLMELAEQAVGVGSRRLRKGQKGGAIQPRQSGADKARIMLNEMIGESATKYDVEIAKCTDYYSKTCGLMTGCRGEISAANYKAAHSRELILAAQTQISISETNLPKLTVELAAHKKKCKHEIASLKDRITIVMGDISIMTMILKMTDCDAKKKSLLQMQNLRMLKCKSKCTKNQFVTFDNKELSQHIDKLQSKNARHLLSETLGDMGDADAFVQMTGEAEIVQGEIYYRGAETTLPTTTAPPNISKPNLPPIPRTDVPANPCTDPYGGAPSAKDKAAAKCTIGGPQCYKLQERFMLIQSGIMDERDELQESLKTLEDHCEDYETTLSTDIDNEETILKEEGTKLATATTEESNAGEKARQVAKQHDELKADLEKMMATCSKNYIAFEGEMCGLRKIRGELAKLMGEPGKPAFFQDCKLSKWEPGECSKSCAGGQTTLTRKVMTQPEGGTACLPLESERRCNDFPCPIDCHLDTWSGWSRCSAECGGGVTQRLRDIKKQMKYNGEPCGETSEAKACNVQACEADCELNEWTEWTSCSKECDAGTQKRQKFVKKKALGEGKCAGLWDKERLEYKMCNTHGCVKNQTVTVMCNTTLDVVLMLDGSGSLGENGWEKTKEFTKMVVGALANSNVNLALMTFSGPRTWSGVSKCMGEEDEPKPGEPPLTPPDLEKDCKMKFVQHFEPINLAKTTKTVDGMEFPKGGTLTSLALGTVATELTLSRKEAPITIIVVTDGRPLSFKRTREAARAIRKQARLVWVPVTKFAPLKDIKTWASRRWEENVVVVEGFDKLATPITVDYLIADICHNLHGTQDEDTLAVANAGGDSELQ